MPLLLTDPTCIAEVAKLQAGKLFFADDAAQPREKRFVVANGVLLREGPSTAATAYQKLGYGVEVFVVARGCADGWSLVVSPYGAVAHGVGFIRDDLLGATLLSAAAVDTKRARAVAPKNAAAWALIAAVYFPSPAPMDTAVRLQAAAAAAVRDQPPAACDTWYGDCALLALENDHGQVGVPRAIAAVGTAPWWTLPSATEPAELALFRAAYIATTGECNSCGTETCASWLQVAVTPIDGGASAPMAASRRPPPSWFTPVSTAPCAQAEAMARASSFWQVPISYDTGDLAVADPGECVPGDDGSAWWVQPFDLSTSDSPQWRSYRVWPSRGVTVRVERTPLALRDFDGDGDVETLWGCPTGWVCSDDPGLVSGWEVLPRP